MTNGEKLKEIFPCETKEQPYNYDEGSVFYEGLDFLKLFRTSWWNAEYKEPTTKNDIGVEYISRAELMDILSDYYDTTIEYRSMLKEIAALPSVTPQEPILDKIIAVVEKWRKEGTNWSDIRLMDIEDILDKYKAESEGI